MFDVLTNTVAVKKALNFARSRLYVKPCDWWLVETAVFVNSILWPSRSCYQGACFTMCLNTFGYFGHYVILYHGYIIFFIMKPNLILICKHINGHHCN